MIYRPYQIIRNKLNDTGIICDIDADGRYCVMFEVGKNEVEIRWYRHLRGYGVVG